MKLTPAETIELNTNWTKFVAESGVTLELTEERRTQFIRQIQADALRYAAEVTKEFGREKRLVIHKLEYEANQLHPLPEKQRVTLEQAQKLAIECTGNDAIEPANEAHAEWLRTHPQGGVER